MIFSFMCTSANAKVRSDKSYNLLGKKNKRERKARVASGGGGQHLKTKKKEMVLTAECTVCFTFWLMHSHNLPTLFYCIYIWPHTKIYRCMCGVWPLYRTCPSDRHPDGWSCQRLCVFLIKQSNDPVCRPHTHTQHELTNTLRHTEKWYDEERRNCKRRWGKYFFFLFCFLNWPPARTVKETQWFCFMFIRNTRTEAVKPLACLSEMWVHTRPTLMIQFEFLF